MNSKYAVPDDLQTWADVEAYHDRLGAALSANEISQLEWEANYHRAAHLMMSRNKERVLAEMNDDAQGNRIECECGSQARFKEIKKNS